MERLEYEGLKAGLKVNVTIWLRKKGLKWDPVLTREVPGTANYSDICDLSPKSRHLTLAAEY